jgi:membrane protease YdiL (CAAX protease family)
MYREYTGEVATLSNREAQITATPSQQPPLTGDPLPERVAAIALLIPVLLMVGLPGLTGVNGSSAPIELTDARLARAFGVELVLTATLGLWLWRQGWRPHRSDTRPFVLRDLARGMGLWVAAILSVGLWAAICRIFLPKLITIADQTQILGAARPWITVPFSVFNAVFEELLWLAVGLGAFRRLGLVWAGAISVGLRVFAHAYQGPLALVTIIPIGIVFTAYYIRTRRLWPVVIALAFQDILAFEVLRRMSNQA